MRFGKYAGRIFQDVAANEPGYARWCCGQETLSESFTVSVQSEEVQERCLIASNAYLPDRVTARQEYGFSFRDSSLKEISAERLRTSHSVAKSPDLHSFFVSSGIASSLNSVSPTPFLREWTAKSLAHASYDLESRADFHVTCNEIRAQVLSGDQEKCEFDRHVQWLLHKSHCRFSWDRSDASQSVVQHVMDIYEQSQSHRNCISYVVALYCGANHRSMIEPFVALTDLSGRDFVREIWQKVQAADHHVIDWRRFPVSSATGCAECINEGWSKEQLQLKTALLANVYAQRLKEACQVDSNVMTSWSEIKRTSGCSSLQAIMISRVWCKAFKAEPTGEPECWTKHSAKFVPRCYRDHPPCTLGRHLGIIARSHAVGNRVMDAALQADIIMYDGAHVEHLGCENRKSTDDVGDPRP